MKNTPNTIIKHHNQYIPNISQTFAAIKEYGVPKSTLLHEITSHKFLRPNIQEALKEYFLLYSSPEHFIQHSHEGIYYRELNCTQYIIVYDKISRKELLKSNQLSLSFRVPHPEYNLPSYVYVSGNGN